VRFIIGIPFPARRGGFHALRKDMDARHATDLRLTLEAVVPARV
jgi:hypothetical protein